MRGLNFYFLPPPNTLDFKESLAGLLRFLFILGFYLFLSHF